MGNTKCIFNLIKIFLIMEILTMVLVPFVFIVVFGEDGIDAQVTMMSNVSQCIILGISWFYLHKESAENALEQSGNNNLNKIYYIALVILIFLGNNFFLDGVVLIKIGTTNNFMYANTISSVDIITFLKLFLCYGFFPAFCEEFFYRKMFCRQLDSNFPRKTIMVISGILFSIAHHSLDKLLPMFLLGYILMWIYVKTHKIVWCIIFHSIYNVLELIFQHIFVLPSSSSLISFKYASGLECIVAGVKYVSVGIILYLIIYWLMTGERNGYHDEKKLI